MKERRAWRQIAWCGGGMPLLEPAAGSTSRYFSSLELFDRTRSCGVLESRTASEMTDHRVPRLGRRVSPPATATSSIEGGTTPWAFFVELIGPHNITMS